MDKRKAKSYALEFKKSSAQLAATSDQPITQTAKDLGVNPVRKAMDKATEAMLGAVTLKHA